MCFGWGDCQKGWMTADGVLNALSAEDFWLRFRKERLIVCFSRLGTLF